jgi:membrane protein DedA with SNARE-associated domain
MDLPSLIQHYGYFAIFIGTLLEGETWVALGGFAVYQGYLFLPTLLVVSIAGALIGDQAFFLFGRYKGKAYLAKHPNLRSKIDRYKVMIEKHRYWLIISSRFMYGFRAILPIAFGVSSVPWVLFLSLNLIGAIVWAMIFAVGGMLFGGAIQVFLGDIKKIEGYLLLVLIVVIFSVQFFLWQRRRKKGDN